MKNLTRKSLDELASIMPNVGELEQAKYIAGVKYYTPSGHYLGSIGSSPEIRIFNGTFPTTGVYDEYNNDVYNNSTSFSSSSAPAQRTILSSMANSLGYDRHVDIFNDSGFNGICRSKDNIAVSCGSNIYKSGHYYDIMSVLIHEIDHANARQDTGNRSSEYSATLAQYNSSYFSQYSTTRQNEIINRLINKYNHQF